MLDKETLQKKGIFWEFFSKGRPLLIPHLLRISAVQFPFGKQFQIFLFFRQAQLRVVNQVRPNLLLVIILTRKIIRKSELFALSGSTADNIKGECSIILDVFLVTNLVLR